MTVLRIVVEGDDEPTVVERVDVGRAPFAGELMHVTDGGTVALVGADEDGSDLEQLVIVRLDGEDLGLEGSFRVDRVGWGPQGDATAFVRPEA